MRPLPSRRAVAMALACAVLGAAPALAQDACPSRGQLDTAYCDANGDLVADAPKDPAKWKDPAAIVWAYTPVEDPSIYANIFKPVNEYLAQCTGKRVIYYPVQSNAAQIEAMRSGRLHMAAFSSGSVGFAVNLAGAVPFAAHGRDTLTGYRLYAIVRASSAFQKLSDLKGKKVAHTAPSSNSGHLAPQVLFPAEGLKPGDDYKPLMSGGHDKSILGTGLGDYDMAAVASNVFDRMAQRGHIKGDDFRIIYKSDLFPSSGYSHAHDLKPELAVKLIACMHAYRFPPEMVKEFNGNDRFFPITYRKDWAVVREVAEKSGSPYNRASFEAETKREAADAAKRAQAATKPVEPKKP